MIMDHRGVIYGTTNFGGAINGDCPTGCGVVFRLAPSGSGSWTYSVIYTFPGQPDSHPYGTLLEDGSGDLYGLAYRGNGQEIFRLKPPAGGSGNWTWGIAYVPRGGISHLTAGGKGVLYGVEVGDFDINAGSLFQLTPQASGGYARKVLANFNSGPDSNPNAVTVGPSGVLYGTLSGGTTDGGMVISVQ